MQLLIDMGNSRLKWGLNGNRDIISGEPVLYSKRFEQQLLSRWKGIEKPDNIAISCVNAFEWLEIVRDISIQLWSGIQIRTIKPLAEGYGVKSAYHDPEKLGVDRWLALLASRKYYPFSTCIVDCGTATTIDLLEQDGQHLGGVIAPGLTLMKKSLAQGAEDLEFLDGQFPTGLADNTEAAIYNGALFSMVGLIEHITLKNPGFQLILTGGDAQIVAKELSMDFIIQFNLVLQGLALVTKPVQNVN